MQRLVEIGWARVGVLLGGVCLAASGCALSFDEGGGSPSAPLVRTGSGAELSAVPAVCRLIVTRQLPVPLEDIWLVEGPVSSVSAGRLQEGKIPETVLKKRRPLSGWRESDEIVLAPGEVLTPGESYSLVALGAGLLAEFSVETRAPLVLHPVALIAEAGSWAAYCRGDEDWFLGSKGEALFAEPQDLDESSVRVGLAVGLAEDRCLRLLVPGGSPEPYVPPPHVGAVQISPTPIVRRAGSERTPEADDPVDQLHIDGSNVSLDVREGYTFVQVEPSFGDSLQGSDSAPIRSAYFRADERTSLPLGSFSEGSYRLRQVWVSQQGGLHEGELSFDVVEQSAHLLISEVLANPRGQEPEGEWVELMNVGRGPVSLSGYLLRDAKGEVALPDVTLEAGAVGLIVREDFVLQPELDQVPAAEAVALPVIELGDGGLLNSGEPLSLLSPGGRLVSSFPARSAASGVSIARRDPLRPQTPFAFGPHAAPGSSPGKANVLADAEGAGR